MKTLSSFIVFVLIGNFSFSQGDDWIKDTCEIKGPVKYLLYTSNHYYNSELFHWEEHTYEYNEKRYMIRHGRSSSSSGVNFNAFYRVFDASGTLCLIDYYLQEGDTVSYTKFSYDQEGKVTKSVFYNWGRYWNTTTYTYDERGLLTEYRCKTADGQTYPESFQYDANGRMIYHEDISTTVKQLKYWTYDDNGFLIEEKYLDSNRAPRTTHYIGEDETPDSIVTVNNSKSAYTEDSYVYKFRYNDKGQLIEKMETDVLGNLIEKEVYTYNESGDPATCLLYTAKSDIPGNYTYEYVYDEYGNWIRKTTKVDGRLFREETQVITYY